MVQPSGTMAQSLKHSNEELSCSLTRSTLPLIKFSVSKASLKEMESFLKKIGKFIRPTAGFNVIATANTKGKGSDDGRFIGTNVLNEAFLERFPVTFEQNYPTPAQEKNILMKLSEDADFCGRLVDWADIIRKTFYDGGIDEIISTRRLVHIIRAYGIFGNKAKAIDVCTARFDDETKQAFIELYDKVDADFQMPVDETTVS